MFTDTTDVLTIKQWPCGIAVFFPMFKKLRQTKNCGFPKITQLQDNGSEFTSVFLKLIIKSLSFDKYIGEYHICTRMYMCIPVCIHIISVYTHI